MLPLAAWTLLAGALGLAVGSFLNVVVYRVPAGLSVVHPASRCPACGAAIRSRHNVPVLGWLVLRGRCHDCSAPISPRYPLVEAATGALFAAITHLLLEGRRVSWVPPSLALTCLVLVAALVAADGNRLPRRFAGASAAVVAALVIIAVVA